MTDTNQPQDILTADTSNSNQLPSMLNVLTILTFIGCAFSFIGGFMMKLGCKVLDMEEVASKLKESELEVLEKTCANFVVILAITIVGASLCLIGAILMRKLKKQGFYIYILGQILPIIAMIPLVGIAQYSDPKQWAGLVLIIIFIGLYASQQKHLVK